MTDTPNVHPALAAALEKRGYDTLTPVQTKVSDVALAEEDLLVSAQTGSGKTVAFGLAMAHSILGETPKFGKGGAPKALIVAPTRELALQVKRELDWLYGPANAKIASCVGGMDQRDERRVLKGGVHIVVGTPGRLSDHIKRNNLDTSEIEIVVLDEADEMLDMGFRDELEHILEGTPDTRRTLMFSATVAKGIANLARRYQKNAQRITTEAEQSQHLDIDYQALTVAPGDEENAIVNLLRFNDSPSALVFCATRAAVNRLTQRLNNRGFSVVALSGEYSQKERTNSLQALRDGRARVCVATDVAARGLDLQSLNLVIHADLPKNRAGLLHRSGRTGRAGRKGVSALIVPGKARRRIERLLTDARIDATWGRPPSADDIRKQDDTRLLADDRLTADINETEADIVKALLEQHSPEKIAAAFVRQHRAGRSAPEDLRDVRDEPQGKQRKGKNRRDSYDPTDDRGKRAPRKPRADHADFGPDAWVELSIGRKKNAEARWLIPVICKAADISSDDIGAIRISANETHVQLKADAAEQFFDKLGQEAKLEKGIKAVRADGPPAAESRSRGRDRDTRRDNDRAPSERLRDTRKSSGPSGKKPYIARKTSNEAPNTAPKPKGLTRKEKRAAKFGKPYTPSNKPDVSPDSDPLTAYLQDDTPLPGTKKPKPKSKKPFKPRVKPGAKGGDAPMRRKKRKPKS